MSESEEKEFHSPLLFIYIYICKSIWRQHNIIKFQIYIHIQVHISEYLGWGQVGGKSEEEKYKIK